MGPPPTDALQPGWLQHALDLGLAPVSPAGTIAFRVGDEEASLVGGRVVAGIAPDHDVFVEADPTGFYYLVAEGRHDGVRIQGDAVVLDQLIAAFAPRPEPSVAAPV
jgi:hypothetical protein